jgi:hypothetical protein
LLPKRAKRRNVGGSAGFRQDEEAGARFAIFAWPPQEGVDEERIPFPGDQVYWNYASYDAAIVWEYGYSCDNLACETGEDPSYRFGNDGFDSRFGGTYLSLPDAL